MDAIKAVEGYILKLKPSRILSVLTAKKPAMTTRVEAAFNEYAGIYETVSGVLSEESVPTIAYPKYRAFGNQVQHLLDKFGGGVAMVIEVALLQAKWKARGCTEQVLIKIRLALGVPAPPAP